MKIFRKLVDRLFVPPTYHILPVTKNISMVEKRWKVFGINRSDISLTLYATWAAEHKVKFMNELLGGKWH